MTYTISYADGLFLMAEVEEDIKGLLSKLDRYLEKKRMELNVAKTNVMRFRKGVDGMREIK